MTATAREGQAARSVYVVEPIRDPAAIRAILEPEREYAAYALAQLDTRLFAANQWVISRGESGREALVVHSHSGLGNALFAIGDPTALDIALSLHPGARFSFGSLKLEHKPIVQKYYVMTRPQLMQRMTISRDKFEHAEGAAVRLTPPDVPLVNRLYSIEGGATAYVASHMTDGVYYGVFENGDLISIAGTHVVSRNEGVAVVGNVFTHPRHRGKGHATLATSAVTKELLQFCELVVLTVEAQNDAAVRVYTRLGYKSVCNLHETPLIRKEPIGVFSSFRRAVAGWRGRHAGKEIVVR
jgi:GNAT superfamily N-acetyltransferase